MSEKHSSPRSPAWRMWQPAVKLGTAGLTLSVLGGCFGDSIVKHSPGDTYGEILVSPPRVASRQRLVEDRLEQEKWLRSQLNKEIDVSSAQGKSDLRSAVSLALGAQVNFDPLQMPVFAAQQKKSLDDTTRANELESLKFQLEQKRLKATLDQAASETDPAKIASPYADSANANTPTASSAGKPSVDFSKLTDTLNTMSSRIDALDKRTLPSPTVIDSTARSSAIDEFRDRLAYREEVRNELILNALDDRHDVQGNALYRLNFDATVLPGNDTSAWAVIGVCVQKAEEKDDKTGRCYTNKQGVNESKYWKLNEADIDALQFQLSRLWRGRLNAARVAVSACAENEKMANCLNGNLRPTLRRALQSGYFTLMQKSSSTSTNNSYEINSFTSLYRTGSYKLAAFGEEKSLSARFADNICEKFKGSENDKIKNGVEYTSDTGTKFNVSSHILEACYEKKGNAKYEEIAFELIRIGSAIREGGSMDIAKKGDGKSLLSVKFCDDRIELNNNSIETPTLEACNSGCGVQPKTKSAVENDNSCSQNKNANKTSTKDRKAILKHFGDRNRVEIYAYAGTPKEQVQRISEVASRSQAIEFALAVQAIVSKTVGLDAFIDYTKKNEAFFQALRRQPLVVGFGHSAALSQNDDRRDALGRQDFGWVVGPRWGIKDDGKHGNFRHTVSQQGLSAVISVPSWWEEVDLVVTRKWISDKGDVTASSSQAERERIKYRVRLPADPSGILAILRPEPQIEPEDLPDNDPVWQLTAGKPGQIVIRGRDLWRNPVVMLGGQKANDVSVLPDMEGIIARFDTVERVNGGVAAGDPSAKNIPVFLSTSEGSKIVAYASITDPAKTASTPTAQSASVPGNVVFAGKPATVALTLPIGGYYELGASYRAAETKDVFRKLGEAIVWKDGKTLQFKTPSGMGKAPGDKLEMRLLVTERKNQEAEIVGFNAPVWYFDTADALRPKKAVTFTGNTCKVLLNDFPKAFAEVYQQQIGNLAFNVEEAGDSGATDTIAQCVFDSDKKTCVLDVGNASSRGACPDIRLSLRGLPDGIPEPVSGTLSWKMKMATGGTPAKHAK